MRRSLIAVAIAAIVIAQSLAIGAGPAGFDTTSCVYPSDKPLPGSGSVITVGVDTETIQDAVDAAHEGDTVLIGNGTYNEGVVVKTPGLRIRGESRTGVVLDGNSTKDVGIEVEADRVVVENLTVHNYKSHGIHFLNVHGYWARYITAYNFGLYGIFAFGSRCGEMSYSYASGGADSGFYIGQCYPCDAVIHHIDAQENGLGYSGTNAGGNLTLRDSIWNNNALGIVPNSLDSEARPPQRGITIEHNIIDDNNGKTVPGTGIQASFYGVGIAIAGGESNHIFGNTITNSAVAGVVLVPLPSSLVYIPSGNTVWGNTVTHDAAEFPDAFDLAQGAGSGPNNCWSDNTYGTSAPPMIDTLFQCGLTVTPPGGDPRVEVGLIEGIAGLTDRVVSPWETWPAPTCAGHPSSCVEQSNDTDGAVDSWLPALGLDA